MIDNDTFRIELDGLLRRRKLKKHERAVMVSVYLKKADIDRNEVLEKQLALTLAFEKEQKEKKTIPLEKNEQMQLVEWFKKSYPGKVIMMIRNDGYRTHAERPEQLLMGLHPGAADLFIPEYLLWVEMKRINGTDKDQSENQVRFQIDIEDIGHRYILGFGFEDAKDKILDVIAGLA